MYSLTPAAERLVEDAIIAEKSNKTAAMPNIGVFNVMQLLGRQIRYCRCSNKRHRIIGSFFDMNRP